MTKATKILLTIPSVLALSYMLTFWFPTEFHWLVPSMKAYYIQVGTLQALTILQLVILIRKLWSFINLEKSKKTNWTWLLILFNSITSLIFIWKRVDEFEEINNKKTPNKPIRNAG
tara:strand:- start:160 stop:507 length:348 start_codon:yes stop_codon:yes gene_type:complete